MKTSSRELNEKVNEMRNFLENTKNETFEWQVQRVKMNFWDGYSRVVKKGILLFLSNGLWQRSNYDEMKKLITYGTTLILSIVALAKPIT